MRVVLQKKIQKLELKENEINNLKKRLHENNLNSSDVNTIISILDVFISMRILLQKRKIGLLNILRKIFGVKTEKTRNTSSSSDSKSSKKKNSTKGNRNGRKGRDDYPGATKKEVSHESLKDGDKCPECKEGVLRDSEPAVDYDWQGHAPISLDIYLLQRLVCNVCKKVFTAKSSVAETAKTVDDSSDEVKVSRCNRNALANAMIASLRFCFGVPHYRLAKIQNYLGIGLPVATQYMMLEQVASAGESVYEQLIVEAAQGGLLYADDTHIKILDWYRIEKPPNLDKKAKKRATTSAVISDIPCGHTVVLYITGERQAGAEVSSILAKRNSGLTPPLYMSDALAANNVKGSSVIELHCLDHARRKFYDLESYFKDDCKFVLDKMRIVYCNDAKCKELGLTPLERLAYHQKHSEEAMNDLGEWMSKKYSSGLVEENAPFGQALNYCLKRWSTLTEFLRIPGAPLSNGESERTIKWAIMHRKNSLFYKTENGARNGDIIQSLVSTCEKATVNPIKYLAWLQENKSKVKVTPELYLPWLFKE